MQVFLLAEVVKLVLATESPEIAKSASGENLL